MLHHDLINVLKDMFGRIDNVRPSHAKGVFVQGSFTPTDEAKEWSTAPQFSSPSTPVVARFSLFTGIPNLPSTDPNAYPHGLAVRFLLGDGAKTDIICQSIPQFPAATAESVLEFFKSYRDNTMDDYVKDHPEAVPFLQAEKKTPKNFGTQSFYSINAFKLVNAAGKGAFIRYRWIPLSGRQFLTQSELEAKGPNFLFDELPDIFAQGPISFKLVAQVAGDGDITDNCTEIWPEDRKLVELGVLSLTKVAGKEDLPPQKDTIVFNAMPGVQGIEPSADPVLAARSRSLVRSA
ncbi:heme-dependent catalase [Trichoderma chlorosporum]